MSERFVTVPWVPEALATERAALDQARVLLEQAADGEHEWSPKFRGECANWLRAHPATATPSPEVRYMRGTSGTPVVNVPDPPWGREPATPAATGAKRCPQCRMTDGHKMDCTDPSRKDQGNVSERRPVWRCKIGRLGTMQLPDGCDLPMRMAVREAYRRITGEHADFVFSGWNTELTDAERAVVEGLAKPEEPE